MKKQPFLFAVSGVKNSGKTTLIKNMLPVFTRYGLRVATIKHDGHEFQADVPGTDTFKHLEAGAYGTAVFSQSKYMLVKREENVSERTLAEYFPEADLILLEGFKHSGYPKIEVVRDGNSDAMVCTDENVAAVAADFPVKIRTKTNIPVLDLNDAEEAAKFILDEWFIRTELSMAVLAGGKSSRMGTDKADLCYEGKTFLKLQTEKGKELGISDILISGYRGNRCEEALSNIKDRYSEKGPLGGLEATLRAAKGTCCLVMTVDTPLVTVEVLRKLVRCARKTWMSKAKGEKGSPVFVIKHGERTEPLLGIYRTDLAEKMEEEIKNGNGSVFRFLRKTGYDVTEVHAPEEIFQNINSPEAYERITRQDNTR